jgi:hypothetical protein
MGKRKEKSKRAPKVQPQARRSSLLIPGILALVVAVGIGSWFFLQRSSPQVVAAQYTGGARLWVDNDYIDFGTVRFEKFVQASFRLRNVGNQPLRLPSNPPVDVVEGC